MCKDCTGIGLNLGTGDRGDMQDFLRIFGGPLRIDCYRVYWKLAGERSWERQWDVCLIN